MEKNNPWPSSWCSNTWQELSGNFLHRADVSIVSFHSFIKPFQKACLYSCFIKPGEDFLVLFSKWYKFEGSEDLLAWSSQGYWVKNSSLIETMKTQKHERGFKDRNRHSEVEVEAVNQERLKLRQWVFSNNKCFPWPKSLLHKQMLWLWG